ncbi:hypothetical protein IJ670_07680, partial [bacterium]|nr:hypothetical protein [bacterium]
LPLGIYLAFKDTSKKLALFGALLGAINLMSIVQSQEARGYTFYMLLVPIAMYFAFKYIENPTKKNLIYNVILNIIMLNSHYYLIVFAGFNFLWIGYYLCKKNQTKEFLKFFIYNALGALTTIPYLFVSLQRAVSQNFNSWIANLGDKVFMSACRMYFEHINIFIAFVLVTIICTILVFSKKFKTDEKIKQTFLYLVLAVFTIPIIIYAISISFKPIFHAKIFLSLYSLLIMLEAALIVTPFTFDFKKNKTLCLKALYSIMMTLFVLMFTRPIVKHTLSIDTLMNFIQNDSQKYSKDVELHGFLPDYIEYIDAFSEVKKINKIKWHVVDKNKGENFKKIKFEDYGIKKGKSIVYVSSVGLLGIIGQGVVPMYVKNPNAFVYQTNTSPTVKLKY